MDPEISTPKGSSGQRVALLQQLQSELAQSQAALLAGDWRRIETHTARQKELCRLLRAMHVAPRDENSNQQTLRELANQVRHLNRVNAQLLQWQQRSLRIIICLLARNAPTYSRQSSVVSRQENRPADCSTRLTTDDRRLTTAD